MGSTVDKPVTSSGNCPTDNANGLPAPKSRQKSFLGFKFKRADLGLTGSWVGCRLDPPCRGQQITHSQTPMPRFLLRQSLQFSRQPSGWERKWKHPTALQTCACLFTAHVDQTLSVGLFLATATSILISNYQSVLEPLVHLSPCPCGFPSRPWFFQGYWQTKGNSQRVFLKMILKKIGFLEEHSLHIINVLWIFLHPFANFSFYSER